MSNSASSINVFWGPLKLVGNYVARIFKYLACHEDETPDNQTSLRNLYNSGRIDEIKYHQCREQCWVDSYDPEEIEKPM